MENRRERLSRENRLFMQNKAYWGNDSGRGTEEEEKFCWFCPAGDRISFLRPKMSRLFFWEAAFPGKVPVSLSAFVFRRISQKQRSRFEGFLSGRAAVRRPPDFCLSGKGNFFDGKVRLFLDRKGMNLYTG